MLQLSNTLGVVANDSDDPGDALTVSLISGVEHGTLSLAADGSFAYTPLPDFAGLDQFTYQISDGLRTSRQATVTLDVTAAAVRTRPDSFQTRHDQPLDIAVSQSLLVNDWEVAHSSLSAVLDQIPAHGTLNLSADGSFHYAPQSGFIGTDVFTYRASNGVVASAPTTVTIEVTNSSPAAGEDHYSIRRGRVLTVAAERGVLSNDFDDDGETLTAVVSIAPSHGSLVLAPNGAFTFTPAADYQGQDRFTYHARDIASSSPDVTVTLNVYNNPPVATGDEYAVWQGRSLEVGSDASVLVNDDDDPDESLAAVLVDDVAHGTLTLHADGTFLYVPDSGFVGSDHFTYRASDGIAQSQVVTATINVRNADPVSLPDVYEITHDRLLTTGVAGGVLGNDFDGNGDSLLVTLVTGASHGTLTLRGDGSFDYAPAAGYVGSDAFVYRAADGAVATADTLVAIKIQDNAPTAGPDTYRLHHDSSLDVPLEDGLWFNDTDVDGDDLTIAVVDSVDHGTLVLGADGAFQYTPAAGFVGQDRFVYRISDGALDSDEATVVLDVQNQAPEASPDTYLVPHDHVFDVSATQGILANDWDYDDVHPALALVDNVARVPSRRRQSRW